MAEQHSEAISSISDSFVSGWDGEWSDRDAALQTLYGREQELIQLRHAFQQVRTIANRRRSDRQGAGNGRYGLFRARADL